MRKKTPCPRKQQQLAFIIHRVSMRAVLSAHTTVPFHHDTMKDSQREKSSQSRNRTHSTKMCCLFVSCMSVYVCVCACVSVCVCVCVCVCVL